MAAADTRSAQVMPRRPGPVPPVPDRVDALAEATAVGKVARLGSRRVGNCPGRVAEGGDGQAESLRVAPLEVASARVRVGVHADRTAFTGRDLTHVVGRVETEGLVGTYPDELGAGLPYG
jgi:hypothetical protein